jgi:hypothetical protein
LHFFGLARPDSEVDTQVCSLREPAIAQGRQEWRKVLSKYRIVWCCPKHTDAPHLLTLLGKSATRQGAQCD